MIKSQIILKQISVNQNLVSYTFETSSNIGNLFKSNVFFCEYDDDMSNIPKSILSIPFVGSFIALSWLENASLWVDELDKSFYDAMKRVKAAYQEMYQDCALGGRLISSKIIKNEIPVSSNKMLLFGGGVDAHTTFIRHFGDVSHIVNIQGWFTDLLSQDKAADADKQHCEIVAKTFAKTFKYVRSNFASIVKADLINRKYSSLLHDQWWHGLQHSMAFISISIPLAYKFSISSLLIGSSFTVGNNSPCASHVTTDSEFAFANNGEIIHDAFELSRQQKTGLVVEFQKKYKKEYPLKVCSFNDKNCCACEKCFRTIIGIVAEGGNPANFGFFFNGSLKEHWSRVLSDKIALWGVSKEMKYVTAARHRIEENYENIHDKQFADWLLKYDFEKEKKKALKRYYLQNFFRIIKRKIKTRLKYKNAKL